MTGDGIVRILVYLAVLTALGVPLGAYMARVYEGRATFAQRVLGPVERGLYRLCGVRADEEMTWQRYAGGLLLFSVLSVFVVYALQRLQGMLPLNPAGLGPVTPEVSWNTATSFATNTNWQAYGGETTMSHLTQMLALTVQNFVSAAVGMAVMIALVRGFTRKTVKTIGSFWVDLTRSVLYVLLPLALVLATALVATGVPQTFDGTVTAQLVDPAAAADGTPVTEQTIAVGPVASQIAIKQLGTNGGGYYNVNSAHPLENPTPFSNFLEVLAILLIPAAFVFLFGQMVGDKRQGRALYAAMLVITVPLMFATVAIEQAGNPTMHALGADGPNMEGKEVRYGPVDSGIWAVATTAASNGSVNSMHDSYMPLGGMIPMWMMQLGEIIYGGVGSGLYGLLMYAVIAVFIAGLMVGRTPEYLGKKIEAYEMKMASLVILIPAAAVLIGTAIACAGPWGTSTLNNPGAHGFSEILYAFSSSSNNNGSAFAGITVSGFFYATMQGVTMLLGRYWVIVPVLAIAGSLARKKSVPVTAGTLPTHTPLFVLLLAGTILLVGALTFVPALALGPVIEHLQLWAGVTP